MVAFTTVVLMGLASLAVAHPGHDEYSSVDHVAKRNFLANAKRSLGDCSQQLEQRGTLKIAEERRQAFVNDLQRKQSLKIRDTASVVNTSHHSDMTGVTPQIDPTILFGSNSTCILNPEGEIGPFWVSGELNREDISDGEPGVISYMNAQFINVNTCEPIEDLWWDVWSCNSTGVYSGVQSDMNGNGDDASNLDNLALRGIQKTDVDGIAQFKSVFPGHYDGRATHVHIVAHVGSSLLPNNTISGGSAAHIGQFFWDQDLITKVEATYPYNTNDVDITLNAVDHVVIDETEDSSSDPFFYYVLLGDELEDGIYSWITVGVDPEASYETSAAATLTEDGGVSNDSGAGAGGQPPSSSGVPSASPSDAA